MPKAPNPAKTISPRQWRSIISKIKRHKEAIAYHRDALRDIHYDLDQIIESTNEGLQSLDVALDQLSEFL
jgi:hypothetical protein